MGLSNAVGFFMGLLVFLAVQKLPLLMAADCPLDLSGTNFTLMTTLCSNNDDRGKCCRSISAFIAISVARYANTTNLLGVSSNLSDTCLQSITETLKLYGVPRNATIFCGLGTKIPVNYKCRGRTSVTQMLQSLKFVDVPTNCKVSLAEESNCRKCLNAGLIYLHHLVGAESNLTLSTCRDATFVTLASQVDVASALDMASCFFGIQGIHIPSGSAPSSAIPDTSPSPVVDSPSQLVLGAPLDQTHHAYHLTLIPSVGLAVTAIAVVMLLVLLFLIRRKSRELKGSENIDKNSSKSFSPHPIRKIEEGSSSIFRKISFKEIKKATDNFKMVIGQGGFGTVYKAEFSGGLVAAVKRMNKVSEQADDEFCREIDLLARLHHRHLVALRGFCVAKHARFLIYEYMESGSLKDHLHSVGRTTLSWSSRIQIAIDMANALEYLHFYCNPPLCHRDIKSSNILLDENFVAKLADFGFVHASKDGSICFEPVNTEIRGTPGYMDPEYMVTQELTEKSDIYSYGVVLLEMVTGRQAIQDGKNLVEWSQKLMTSESRIPELVDPRIRNSFDLDQLETMVSIVSWCTQREGQARPSIRQVLRLLYESSDPMHSGFLHDVEDEDYEGNDGRGRTSKGKMHRIDTSFHSGDARYLPSSSSTSRSYCSRSFLLETGSPRSLSNILTL